MTDNLDEYLTKLEAELEPAGYEWLLRSEIDEITGLSNGYFANIYHYDMTKPNLLRCICPNYGPTRIEALNNALGDWRRAMATLKAAFPRGLSDEDH